MIRPYHVCAFVCFVLAVSGFGCASDSRPTSKAGPSHAEPIRVRYLAYVSGQALELVNPAHTDPTELYSATRPLSDAGTKVSTDEVMAEMVKHFQDRGFYDQAQPGPAPKTSEGVWSQSIEVETPGKLVHMSLHKGTPAPDRQLFYECAQAFVAIYNNTYQLQSVDRAPDWNPVPRARKDAQNPNGGAR